MSQKPRLAAKEGTKVRRVTTDDAQSSPVSVARVRRAKRPLLWAATGVFLVIGLVVADLWQARQEMHRLIHVVAVSELATTKGYQEVNASFALANSAMYQSSQSLRESSLREIKAECASAAADVQDTGSQMGEVFVLPWHRSLEKAQEAYSAFSKTWQNKFSACADDAARWSDGSTTAQIQASSRVAHRAFTNALPIADGTDRSVIEILFKG